MEISLFAYVGNQLVQIRRFLRKINREQIGNQELKQLQLFKLLLLVFTIIASLLILTNCAYSFLQPYIYLEYIQKIQLFDGSYNWYNYVEQSYFLFNMAFAFTMLILVRLYKGSLTGEEVSGVIDESALDSRDET